jgi:hypothetical protein
MPRAPFLPVWAWLSVPVATEGKVGTRHVVIVCDDHGFPSHDWVQPSAGHSNPWFRSD